jgi:segregation and condensation protein A
MNQETLRIGDEERWVEARGAFEASDASGYQPAPESEAIKVDLPEFGGPLDLLLFLIKKHHIDVFDIPIVLVTEKYLQVIDDMRALDLDVAGEFLVMAATLAHIKSKMLLPPEERPEGEDDEEIGDPRAELVRRLLEYQRYKYAAQALDRGGRLGRDFFERPVMAPLYLQLEEEEGEGEGDKEAELKEIEVFQLILTFADILERAKLNIAHEVTFERISVGARITELIDYARGRPPFTFGDAAQFFGSQTTYDLIVTFLAVLEMAKMKLVGVHQATEDGTIYITPKNENLEAAPDEDELLADLGEAESA